MEGIDMIGVDCQDLPIGLFRSRQPPRLVVLYRYLQSVGNRRHERCDSEARITLSVDRTQKDAWRLDTSSNTQASSTEHGARRIRSLKLRDFVATLEASRAISRKFIFGL